LAAAAGWQYFDAKAQRDRAVLAEDAANHAKLEAQTNARKAEASDEEAKANLRQAQVAQEAADKAKKVAERQKELALSTTTAMKRVSGAAFPKAMQLANLTESAVQSGSIDDEVNAYIDLGLFSYESANRDAANKALENAARLLPQVSQRDTIARYHEALGDIEWSEPDGSFNSSVKEYKLALNSKPDSRTEDRVRLLRKVAAALMTRGSLDDAERNLSEATSEIPQIPNSVERGFISLVNGQISMAKHDSATAVANLQSAVTLLKSSAALSTSFPARLAAGQALQLLGDIEYGQKAPRSYEAYAESYTSLGTLLSDYPTFLDAQLSMEIARLGLRRLSLANRYDTVRQMDAERGKAAFESLFSDGIGKFRYGMSTADVNRLFEVRFGDVNFSLLPRVWEYKTADIRYFCRYFGTTAPPNVGCGAGMHADDLIGAVPGWSDCMRKSAYVVFMFSEDKLFRLAVRFVADKQDCINDLKRSVDTFASTYDIAVSGAGDERRLRYETEHVLLVAKSDTSSVVYEFLQR
jgi:tetratricopeptide (TPR) repeat protein